MIHLIEIRIKLQKMPVWKDGHFYTYFKINNDEKTQAQI